MDPDSDINLIIGKSINEDVVPVIYVSKTEREKELVCARRYSFGASIIFAVGSLFFLVISVITAVNEYSVDNTVQVFGYFMYFMGYTIYFIADYKNNKYSYIFSTGCFIIASIIFSVSSTMAYLKEDSLSNLNSFLGNLAWLVGYIVSFRGELMVPTKTNMGVLSSQGLLHYAL